jgi:cytochrome oxidase Cu insertion factor (SCO1/SenC/PrrC family)
MSGSTMAAGQGVKRKTFLSPKVQILLLLAVVVAPLVVAVFWQPSRFKNYGELVQPARPLQAMLLQQADGEQVDFAHLGRKWTFVYFGQGACPAACRESLYKARQVRAAQGQNMKRVQYVFVVTDGADPAEVQAALPEHPVVRVLGGAPDAIAALAAQFEVDAGTPLDGLDRLYLVDPNGNFMMSYRPDADANGIRKDLGRLLRVSRIG